MSHDDHHDHDDDEPDAPLEILGRAELSRRDALKLLAAGVAAAKAGCMPAPGDEVRPYVHQPPEVTPGVARYYATAMTLDGYATGLLAETHQGRPTKLEGNPAHPSSRGATGAIHQASILDLYRPDRLRVVTEAGLPSAWWRLVDALAAPRGGERWLVLPPDTSPAVGALLDRLREDDPRLRIVHHAPHGRAALDGAALVHGAPRELVLSLDRAEVVVALDADVLGGAGYPVAWAGAFAARHRLAAPTDTPNRLYVAEPAPTPTGTLADRRLAVPAGDVPAVAVALVGELARRGAIASPLPADLVALADRRLGDAGRAWVAAVGRDLARHPTASAIVAGARQPPVVHALAHVLAAALGDLGHAVALTASPRLDPRAELGLADLAAAIAAGQVGAVIVSGCNPVLDAPPGLDLAAAFAAVPLAIHHTTFADETSAACRWVAPRSHWLEAWGDGRAPDGTAAIAQPVIRPLYDSLSAIELLATIAGERAPLARDVVRGAWAGALGGDGWEAALAEGVVPGTALPRLAGRPGDLPAAALAELARRLAPRDGLELDLAPSPAIHDGAFAGNAWLQELPHPVTKLTWGNAAMTSAATAAALGVGDGDVVRVRAGGGEVTVPAIVVPGHADGAITIELGYGRRTPGQPVADGLGGDGYRLRGDDGAAIVAAAEVAATGRRVRLARTQGSLDPRGRAIAPVLRLAALRADPDLLHEHHGPLPTLLRADRFDPAIPQWAMSIDTTICTGCSSCVIACQAENNVPTVGPDGVRRGREMHWLRIDTYVTPGDDRAAGDEPVFVHQPMLCQHCEHAPCEYVCPVFATSHSPDGLNEMTYNRCIGTRFCSNNCPYKVRRFNWFAYDRPVTTAALQRNPDVTVRARGVMEKCTYCVQRIRAAEIQARMERRAIAPGEVVTACQQACPTGAIQFGALQHEGTPMVAWRAEPRRYDVLHHLGTRPRTVYLARVRDGGPEEDEP